MKFVHVKTTGRIVRVLREWPDGILSVSDVATDSHIARIPRDATDIDRNDALRHRPACRNTSKKGGFSKTMKLRLTHVYGR